MRPIPTSTITQRTQPPSRMPSGATRTRQGGNARARGNGVRCGETPSGALSRVGTACAAGGGALSRVGTACAAGGNGRTRPRGNGVRRGRERAHSAAWERRAPRAGTRALGGWERRALPVGRARSPIREQGALPGGTGERCSECGNGISLQGERSADQQLEGGAVEVGDLAGVGGGGRAGLVDGEGGAEPEQVGDESSARSASVAPVRRAAKAWTTWSWNRSRRSTRSSPMPAAKTTRTSRSEPSRAATDQGQHRVPAELRIGAASNRSAAASPKSATGRRAPPCRRSA